MPDTCHKHQGKRHQIKEMKFPVFQYMMPYKLLNNYNMSGSIFWTYLKLELACFLETSVCTICQSTWCHVPYNVNLHQHCCENLRYWMKRALLLNNVSHINRTYWSYSSTQNLRIPEWCSLGFRLSGMWPVVKRLVFPNILKEHSAFIFMGWGFQEPHGIMFKKTWVVRANIFAVEVNHRNWR
jgi:hypothetical protein